MFRQRLMGILELGMGAFLILCALYDSGSGRSSLGFEFTLRNGVLFAGVFYILTSLVRFVLDVAEATSPSFIRSFLTLFEAFSGFAMVISAYCHGSETSFEVLFDHDITIHYGVAILGVYYASRALFQVIVEQTGNDHSSA